MRKIYLELLVDEDIADEILSHTHPRVTVFKAEELTNDNYESIVTSHLQKTES